MKNKKGFTLIELLAVIVILAIIMVIAVPQILNVINNSRKSSWVNSAKLVSHAVELNTTLFDPTSGSQTYSVATLCGTEGSTDVDATTRIKQIADVGDMTVKCKKNNGKYVFTLTGINQFANRSATMTCSVSGQNATCPVTIGTND